MANGRGPSYSPRNHRPTETETDDYVPMTNTIHNIRALLFDLGGVLLDIDFARAFAAWAEESGSDPAVLESRLRFDHAYRRHETGEIDAASYFNHLRHSLGLDLKDGVMAKGWCSIYVGEITGMRDTLSSLADKLPIYAFTNTNPTHQGCWETQFADLLKPFCRIFASCAMGVRKPELEAFQAISDAISVPAAQIMFFDDLQENVEGARAAGMLAVCVSSASDVKRATEFLSL